MPDPIMSARGYQSGSEGSDHHHDDEHERHFSSFGKAPTLSRSLSPSFAGLGPAVPLPCAPVRLCVLLFDLHGAFAHADVA